MFDAFGWRSRKANNPQVMGQAKNDAKNYTLAHIIHSMINHGSYSTPYAPNVIIYSNKLPIFMMIRFVKRPDMKLLYYFQHLNSMGCVRS